MQWLDVRRLQRSGAFRREADCSVTWGDPPSASIRILVPGADPAGVGLVYRVRTGDGRAWEDVEEVVLLARTPCNYGGQRSWWLCPGCGGRCAILYGGRRFLCRLCHRLAYPSTREDRIDRLVRKANMIRARLGGEWAGVLEAWSPPRPRWMHRRTYRRLRDREKRLRQLGLIEVCRRFGLLGLSPAEEDLLDRIEAEA